MREDPRPMLEAGFDLQAALPCEQYPELVHLPLRQKQEDFIDTSAFAIAFAS